MSWKTAQKIRFAPCTPAHNTAIADFLMEIGEELLLTTRQAAEEFTSK